MAPGNKLSNFWEAKKWHMAILFVVSVLLYANTISHDYTQDDAIVIYDNMFTTQGIDGLGGILKYDTFYGFFKEEGKAKLVSGGRYRPFTLMMFAVEYELFGNNPLFGHLINVLLFALLVVLLYKTLYLLLKDKWLSKKLAMFSFVAALIFAVHPIHTEVVANIKGRDEIMSLMLSLLSLYWMLKALSTQKKYFLPLSLGVFFLALLSKENAITFVAIIPLALYLFKDITLKKQWLQIGGLLLVSLVFMVIRARVLGWDFGKESMELMNNPFLKIEANRYIPFDWDEKYATILYTLGKYIQLLIFPHPLTHDYYPRQIAMMSFANWQVILSSLIYIVLAFFAVLKWRQKRVLAFSILFYLATLSIVSNVVFPIGTNMSERFLFMPSVGFVMIIALGMIKLEGINKWLFGVILGSMVILLSVKTITRNQVWENDFTLFTTDVKTSGNSAKVLNAAAGALLAESGNQSFENKEKSMQRQAVQYAKKAIDIHPNYKNAHLILGNASFYLENYEEAIDAYNGALRINPGYDEARNNLAIAYREAGKYFGEEQNDLNKALTYLDQAIALNPEDYETVRLCGIANALAGNSQKALEYFTKGVELQPGNAGAFVNLGNIYYNIGDEERGKMYHFQALEIDPDVFKKNNN